MDLEDISDGDHVLTITGREAVVIRVDHERGEATVRRLDDGEFVAMRAVHLRRIEQAPPLFPFTPAI